MSTSLSSRGFTLIETLVAIAILTVAIIGPFVAIQNALVASYAARDQLTASMLAQEAIEYVRAIRDGNYIYNVANPSGTPRSWFYGIDSTGGVNCVDRNCTIDATQSTHAWCGVNGSGTCSPLNRSSTSYLYSHQGGAGNPASIFTRTVRLTSLNAREMQITVTMSWSTGHRPYSITITETLSAWL